MAIDSSVAAGGDARLLGAGVDEDFRSVVRAAASGGFCLDVRSLAVTLEEDAALAVFEASFRVFGARFERFELSFAPFAFPFDADGRGCIGPRGTSIHACTEIAIVTASGGINQGSHLFDAPLIERSPLAARG